MKFKLSVIQANPYRHLESYPIKPEKVAALAASIEQTGFWDNVVARLRPDGKPEIAYGHHRLEAAKKALGRNSIVDLIIRDLDDETMIKIMANENMTEWGTSAIVEQETVRAVVEAFAAGQIELAQPVQGTALVRVAPNYQSVERKRTGEVRLLYSEMTVGRFLGWMKPGGKPSNKIGNALDALSLIEDEEILDTEDFVGLGTTAAEVVIEQTKKRLKASTSESPAQKKRAARRVGKGVAKRLRTGESWTREEQHAAAADVALTHGRPKPRVATNYDQLVEEFLHDLAGTLAHHSQLMKSLREVSANRAEIAPELRAQLTDHIRQAVDRLTEIADELDSGSNVIDIPKRGAR